VPRARARRCCPSPQVASSSTLKQLVAGFLAHEEDTYQGHDERHVSRYKTDLVHYVLPSWTRVDEITSDAWEQAKRELHKKRRRPAREAASRTWRTRCGTSSATATTSASSLGAGAGEPADEGAARRAEEAHRDDGSQRDKFLKALLQLGETRAHRIYTVLFWSAAAAERALRARGDVDRLEAQTITVPGEHSKSGERGGDRCTRASRARPREMRGAREEARGPIFGRFDFHQANTPKLQGGLFGRACLKAGLVKLRETGPWTSAG
jgi:hypothetical protein